MRCLSAAWLGGFGQNCVKDDDGFWARWVSAWDENVMAAVLVHVRIPCSLHWNWTHRVILGVENWVVIVI